MLYAPDELEVPAHCVRSVLELRRFLTTDCSKLDHGSVFSASLRAMRAACRKFLERVGVDGENRLLVYADQRGHWASWTFYSALGEMRGTFGVHLAQVAAQLKIDVEDELAAIIPGTDTGDR